MKVRFINGAWINDDLDLIPTIKLRTSIRINQETQIKVKGTSIALCWLKWGIMLFIGKTKQQAQ